MGHHTFASGRPQASEVAPYYFTYIDRVGSGNVVDVLVDQFEETLALCSGVSEDQSLHRYAGGKWSLRQVLNHVNDAERVFVFRAFWFARGFESDLPSYDQEVAAREAEADGIAWSAHVEEFRRVRLASISFFEHLPASAWMRTGTASDSPFTVRSLAYIVAGHLDHHIALIQNRYLRNVHERSCSR